MEELRPSSWQTHCRATQPAPQLQAHGHPSSQRPGRPSCDRQPDALTAPNPSASAALCSFKSTFTNSLDPCPPPPPPPAAPTASTESRKLLAYSEGFGQAPGPRFRSSAP